MFLGKKSNVVIILVAIFLLVAAFRILLAFQNEHFAYEAYDVLRQAEHIQSTGLPLFQDDLSYGGRERIIAPLYYYLIAFFGLFLPNVLLVKVLPNLLAAGVIFPVYHITRFISDRKEFALISALLAGFVPASFFLGLNDANSSTLAIPLIFLAAYLFLKARKKGRHLNYLLAILIILPFVSFISIILLASMLVYLIILQIERIRSKAKETELFLFFLFYSGWVIHMMLKKAFLTHGTAIIWQNTPQAELSSEFSRITLLQAISSTGLFPLAMGAMGIYLSLSQTRKKSMMLMASILLATLTPLWFKMIPLNLGLYLLSITLVIASSYTFVQLWEQVKRTKFAQFNPFIVLTIIILFFVISFPSSVVGSDHPTPSTADIETLEWSKTALEDATIVATPKEGAFVSYTSGFKNVMDQDYLLIPRIDERYEDINIIYSSFFKINAIAGMEKYGATHLIYTSQAQDITGNTRPKYVVDQQNCFRLIKIDDDGEHKARLYELACSLREGRR